MSSLLVSIIVFIVGWGVFYGIAYFFTKSHKKSAIIIGSLLVLVLIIGALTGSFS